MSPARARVLVSGRVQGVFFRASTRDVARRLGLRGWVRNLPDGGVEAVFEGERGLVEEAVAWCRTGPPEARVAHCDVIWEEPRGEGSFTIR
ncbi:MAG: acylphosphatase [Deferrisomatales bacterium]|nr:acylphosphatase [Deferrisomatales bacterium]